MVCRLARLSRGRVAESDVQVSPQRHRAGFRPQPETFRSPTQQPVVGLEAKSPEATRTVAGGASASERPPGTCVMSEFRPRQGSRRVSVCRRHTGETPRPLTGSKLELHIDPVV